jgi:hypothetical protein
MFFDFLGNLKLQLNSYMWIYVFKLEFHIMFISAWEYAFITQFTDQIYIYYFVDKLFKCNFPKSTSVA